MRLSRKNWMGGVAILGVLVAAGVLLLSWRGETYALAEFKVERLTCGSCAQKIGQALDRLPGIGKVDVDVASGRARVEFDPAQTDPEQVRGAIVQAGYPAALEKAVAIGDLRKEGEGAAGAIGRVGNRLVSREAFEAEIARLRRSLPPGTEEAAAPHVRRLAWGELRDRSLWLIAAEAAGVEVEEAEVTAEMEGLRQSGRLAPLLADLGGESPLRRDLKERLTIERHLERHLFRGVDPSLHSLYREERLRQLAAAIAVEILDPALKASLRGNGCGGCC